MLVGDVRWAMVRAAPTWMLSGGRKWSSSPPNVSKYAHVFRATS